MPAGKLAPTDTRDVPAGFPHGLSLDLRNRPDSWGLLGRGGCGEMPSPAPHSDCSTRRSQNTDSPGVVGGEDAPDRCSHRPWRLGRPLWRAGAREHSEGLSGNTTPAAGSMGRQHARPGIPSLIGRRREQALRKHFPPPLSGWAAEAGGPQSRRGAPWGGGRSDCGCTGPGRSGEQLCAGAAGDGRPQALGAGVLDPEGREQGPSSPPSCRQDAATPASALTPHPPRPRKAVYPASRGSREPTERMVRGRYHVQSAHPVHG